MIEFILYVKDQKKSKQFYSDLLDVLPVLDVSGMTEFLLNENVKLGLMPEDGIAKIIFPALPHPSKANGIPRCELYISDENIREIFDRGLQCGGKMIDPIKARDWGDEVGYLADPDGHVLAFAKKITL